MAAGWTLLAAVSLALQIALAAPVVSAAMDYAWHTLRPQADLSEAAAAAAAPAHRYNHAAVHLAAPDRLIVLMGYYYDHRKSRATWCR